MHALSFNNKMLFYFHSLSKEQYVQLRLENFNLSKSGIFYSSSKNYFKEGIILLDF